MMPNSCKERSKPVEVVLTPDLKRMMVTFGTFQAYTQKQLAYRGRDLNGCRSVPKDDRRSIFPSTATCGDQFPDKLIVGLILTEGLSEPRVQHPHGFHTSTVRVGTQKIGPLVRPIIRILRPAQQLVDQLFAFLRILVRKKRNRFFRIRQFADNPQESAAMKLRIVNRRRRQHPQQLQLIPNMRVHFILTW